MYNFLTMDPLGYFDHFIKILYKVPPIERTPAIKGHLRLGADVSLKCTSFQGLKDS